MSLRTLLFLNSQARFEEEFSQYGLTEDELDTIIWGWTDLGYAVATMSDSLWEKIAAVQQKIHREIISRAESEHRVQYGKPRPTNHTAIVETGEIKIQSDAERETASKNREQARQFSVTRGD